MEKVIVEMEMVIWGRDGGNRGSQGGFSLSFRDTSKSLEIRGENTFSDYFREFQRFSGSEFSAFFVLPRHILFLKNI